MPRIPCPNDRDRNRKNVSSSILHTDRRSFSSVFQRTRKRCYFGRRSGQVPGYLRRKLMNSCPRRKHRCNPLFQQFAPYLISFITFLLLRMFSLIEKFPLIAGFLLRSFVAVKCHIVTLLNNLSSLLTSLRSL